MLSSTTVLPPLVHAIHTPKHIRPSYCFIVGNQLSCVLLTGSSEVLGTKNLDKNLGKQHRTHMIEVSYVMQRYSSMQLPGMLCVTILISTDIFWYGQNPRRPQPLCRLGSFHYLDKYISTHSITPTKKLSRLGAHLGEVIFHELGVDEINCGECKGGPSSSLGVFSSFCPRVPSWQQPRWDYIHRRCEVIWCRNRPDDDESSSKYCTTNELI
jgi:hypothetical protein